MPSVLVLGTAQDGGLPHAGCVCANCRAARLDPARRRLPVSLGVLSGDDVLLIDPTSAFEEQHFRLWSHMPASEKFDAERFPAPQSVLITHAHSGHYAGLWQFDRSVLAAKAVTVSGPPLTIEMLQTNQPWQAMQEDGYITFDPVHFDQTFEALPGIDLELIEVPHRSEWATDTAAVSISGPQRRLLYLPDIDTWRDWDRDLVATVVEYDVVLLDGCFWEAPVRQGVPHPPITQTMDLLQAVADAGDTQVVFTHLNHSNPVLMPDSDERLILEKRGFRIAAEGDVYPL